MAVVDIIIPSGRASISESHNTVIGMLQKSACRCGDHQPWDCNRGKHDVRLIPSFPGTIVHWVRNQAMCLALHGMERPPGRPDTEYFMLIDDDMLCGPNDLNRLLSYKKDFVTGIATVRRDPPRPNIRKWNPATECYEHITEWDWESNKLFEIDAVGMAYCLIKRKVFEVMGKAYLDCKFERDEDKRKYPTGIEGIDAYWNKKSVLRHTKHQAAVRERETFEKADCWWYQFLPNIVDSQLGEVGEDLGFCWKATQLGYKIWADPQILPGHLGQYGYSVMDYREWHEANKEEADNSCQVSQLGAS